MKSLHIFVKFRCLYCYEKSAAKVWLLYREGIRMKLIQQLMYAGIISCSMAISSIANSASFNEAMEAFENRDYVSAYRDFSIVAMTGDRDAQFMLGYVYSKGYGITQNYVQAHKWFNL